MESSDMVFPQGLPEHLKGTKVHEIWNMLLEILPNILLSQGLYTEAISAYRRAIRHVGLNRRTLQLGLAVLLLYSGLEAPECPADIYNGFLPSNSIEEAIYLLMTCVMNNMQTAKSPWDYEAIEHLCFALAIYGNFNVLAEVYESLLPGVYARTERWYSLALCYMAANQKKVALNLLKMSLADNGTQVNKPYITLHAALICTESAELATEGLRYGRRAVEYSQGRTGYLKGRALYILGVLLTIKAGSASSSTERSELIKEAVDALQEAAKLEIMDPEFCFRLGVVYAEQGNLKVALESAKRFLKLSSGASPIGWRFLALVLSAQARHKEAEMVVDAALQEMSKAESTKLLLTKAKLQASQDKHLHALETYKLLLTLLQSPTNGKWRISEVAVWQGMAAVFTSLSQWQDAEKCLEKAKSLNTSCAATWYEYGHLYMGQKKKKEALDAYNAALTCDPDHAESKVQAGALLIEDGKSLPVARSFLNDALRSQPRNASAWYYLGIVHETEGRLEEAIECFKTAFVLDQVRPVESFNTLM